MITNFIFNENNPKENGNLVIFNLLYEISKSKEKQLYLKINNNLKNKTDSKFIYSLYNLTVNSFSISKRLSSNSITTFILELFPKSKKDLNLIIRRFFIKVYIYYQNKHSNLMNYSNITNKDITNDVINIPFIYDLSEANIKGKFASTIIIPTRIEPRINQIILTKNDLLESGLLELSKAILFNKYIKIIDYDFSFVKTRYLEFLEFGFEIFDNFTVEDLNLSFNYLKNDCEEYLAKLVKHFKGLKTLNLQSNELKNGLSSFFIVLKNLYRKKETKLETLNLNKCFLDEISFYELGQMLKSKFCNLKKLYLNENNIPDKDSFFQSLKKNRSLTKIYLNNTNIYNKDINNINKVISMTDIRHLYLYENKINDFEKYLEIIYRTKLINKNNKAENWIDEPTLINLNLSDNNNFVLKNAIYIEFLIKILKETTLNCLDISHALYVEETNDVKSIEKGNEYTKKIKEIIDILKKDSNKYIKINKDLLSNNVDRERYKNIENINSFKEIEKEIFNIIKNKRAIFPPFLN